MASIGYEIFQPKDAHSQTPLCRIRMLRLSMHFAQEGVWLLAEQTPILSSFILLVMVLHTNENGMACARLDTPCLIFFLIKSKFTVNSIIRYIT
jgi:hypothetical protein